MTGGGEKHLGDQVTPPERVEESSPQSEDATNLKPAGDGETFEHVAPPTIGPDGCESDPYILYCTGFGPIDRRGKIPILTKFVDSKLTQQRRVEALRETKKRLYSALR